MKQDQNKPREEWDGLIGFLLVVLMVIVFFLSLPVIGYYYGQWFDYWNK